MRLINQSHLADGSPYRHLGYLASTHVEPQRLSYLTGCTIVAVGAVICVRGCVQGMWLRRPGVGRRNEIVGFFTALAGAALIVTAYATGRTELDHGDSLTRGLARHAAERVQDRARDGKPITDPDHDAELAPLLLDAWKNRMRITITATDIRPRTLITSAGADGVFGTDDDLRFDE